MKSRVTIRDIAEEAECHYSSVSLALRNDPKISKDKRARIQAIAKKLGYRPDPFLSALTAYRTEKSQSNNITCLAWLITTENSNWGDTSSNYPFYFKGAQSRAEERGYRIERFWLHEKGMTPKRMSSILFNRGIVGLLLPHGEKPRPLNLDWDKFSPVCLGYSTSQPKLHMISPNEHQNISTIVREAFLRGYRRPALVESEPSTIRFENHWLGAFLAEQFSNPNIEKIDPYLFREWSFPDFGKWVKAHQPDVIITRSACVREGVKRLRRELSHDISLVSHCLAPGEENITGTTKNAFEMGRMAVDFVVDMLHRNERGIPSIPTRHLMDGCWNEGESLRARPKSHANTPISADFLPIQACSRDQEA